MEVSSFEAGGHFRDSGQVGRQEGNGFYWSVFLRTETKVQEIKIHFLNDFRRNGSFPGPPSRVFHSIHGLGWAKNRWVLWSDSSALFSLVSDVMSLLVLAACLLLGPTLLYFWRRLDHRGPLYNTVLVDPSYSLPTLCYIEGIPQ